MAGFTHRLASLDDLDALREVMRRSIATLQTGFLTSAQVRVSHSVMGLDTQLIKDGTYFVIECEGRIAGCGGWSWRSTLYGGDDSMVSREPDALDPAIDAARIRAMYTDPDFARQGVGRLVMRLCEEAAVRAGFGKATMMATMAGVPLYEACGYVQVDPVMSAPVDGVRVPLVRMEKVLT
ncbi:GNAT family N-acetyltransferase [Sphingomonas sp. URHD0057]|uniref:GNAT family N-acetyltransferase n=1 Tax=Sphingomonas sp. URHD0057 TaxID=1380389 RepID=UPI00048DF6F0|nr:GNAT family N-acetyltransferase [Sphingomonas sp. URHD0057]